MKKIMLALSLVVFVSVFSMVYLLGKEDNVVPKQSSAFEKPPAVVVGSALVEVYIGGVLKGTYNIPKNSEIRKTFPGVNSGPVKIVSTNGVPIVSAINEVWKVGGIPSSTFQFMGTPQDFSENSGAAVYFPSYNNVALDEQLRVANVGIEPTTVTVTIGGIVRGAYLLQPSEQKRVNYAGVNGGPVKISTETGGSQPVVASIREAWMVGGVINSFTQFPGMQSGHLSNKYIFPAYNNVSLDEQLRFANVGFSPTVVTVTIGGVVRGTYSLQPNEQKRVNYVGLNSGPVVVESTPGTAIIASIRDAWMVNGGITSFSQLMGLPSNQISDSYVFPSYDNVSQNSQLRFGNVGTAPTVVTITIGGVIQGTYTLDPSQQRRVDYVGLNSGPVVVSSSNGQPIIAAIRDALIVNGRIISFTQIMGASRNWMQTTNVFPSYNNVALAEEIRIAVPE